jgi:hypothetical protein
MDELCISRQRNLWLWTAVSRYTGQVLAYLVGDRSWSCLQSLWQRVPGAYRRRLVYPVGLYGWVWRLRGFLFLLAAPGL